MVEEMYKETTVVVRVEGETSEQFGVGVGLRQGSALNPLLFIMVMNLISGKVSDKSSVYLSGTMCDNGGSRKEEAALRRVEDTNIVFNSGVCLYP